MFASVAREVIFSNPDVIRRVNADFVPVDLKAALVNNPPNDEEGRMYREIGLSKMITQGICVVNPAGKVLDWALTFDDDMSVLSFLDHALKWYAKYPDTKQAIPAERYMRFPGKRLNDRQDTGEAHRIPERHPKGKHCPTTPCCPKGWSMTHAYLGVLNVQPISNPGHSEAELKKCQFWVWPVGSEKGVTLCRVEGESETYNGEGMANAGPGNIHEVKLTWHGVIGMKGNRVTRVDLSAHGTEQLKFGSARGKIDNEVAILPGGRRIDLNCAVRCGIISESAAPILVNHPYQTPGQTVLSCVHIPPS